MAQNNQTKGSPPTACSCRDRQFLDTTSPASPAPNPCSSTTARRPALPVPGVESAFELCAKSGHQACNTVWKHASGMPHEVQRRDAEAAFAWLGIGALNALTDGEDAVPPQYWPCVRGLGRRCAGVGDRGPPQAGRRGGGGGVFVPIHVTGVSSSDARSRTARTPSLPVWPCSWIGAVRWGWEGRGSPRPGGGGWVAIATFGRF